jgi:hypothetical protein
MFDDVSELNKEDAALMGKKPEKPQRLMLLTVIFS